MQASNFPTIPDKLSYYLKHAVIDSRAVHGISLKLGCLCSTFLSNNLLHAYIMQPNVVDARKLFDEISQPNVVSWSMMISGYAQIGNLREAVVLLRSMQLCKVCEFGDEEALLPNKFTLGSLLRGCAQAKDSRIGVQIHCSAIKFGVEFDNFIAVALINLYAKCGMVEGSWRVFDQTAEKDVVAYSSMITCLANSGQPRFQNAAFGLFNDMICSGVWPIDVTFTSLVKVFDEPKKLDQAKQVHGCIVKLGIEVDDLLGSALIAMYGRCARLDEAVRLSSRLNLDMVSRTSLLVAYMQNGLYMQAIDFFRESIAAKMVIDPFVVASVLGACPAIEELGLGKEIHAYTIRNSFSWDSSVANALITCYGRCGDIRKAEMVFQMTQDRDIISWTALITSYCQNGFGEEALFLFQQVLREGLRPPIFCITGAIRASSTIASLSVGRQIHSRTVKMGIDDCLSVKNSLITMYAKCGSIEMATRVFDSMAIRDTISWNALITGFSHHGLEKETLELFSQMQKSGSKPDEYTFMGILTSCSRVGLIAEGCKYFELMSTAYHLEPKMEHYSCMVDLFGRAGKVHDALQFIKSMPCDPGQLISDTFVASCNFHGNMELAEFAVRRSLTNMRVDDHSPCITLPSIPDSKSMLDGKPFAHPLMKDRCTLKEPTRRREVLLLSVDSVTSLQAGGTR